MWMWPVFTVSCTMTTNTVCVHSVLNANRVKTGFVFFVLTVLAFPTRFKNKAVSMCQAGLEKTLFRRSIAEKCQPAGGSSTGTGTSNAFLTTSLFCFALFVSLCDFDPSHFKKNEWIKFYLSWFSQQQSSTSSFYVPFTDLCRCLVYHCHTMTLLCQTWCFGGSKGTKP